MKKEKQLKVANSMSFKPKLDITSKTLPEIKSWKVGKEYEFTVKGKLTKISIPERYEEYEGYDKGEVKACFEITDAKV